MAVIMDRSFIHSLGGTTEGTTDRCKEEDDEFSLRCHSYLEMEHVQRKSDVSFLSWAGSVGRFLSWRYKIKKGWGKRSNTCKHKVPVFQALCQTPLFIFYVIL